MTEHRDHCDDAEREAERRRQAALRTLLARAHAQAQRQRFQDTEGGQDE